MPQISMDIAVWCATCNVGICHLAEGRKRDGEIEVAPCEECLERAKTEGYDDGYAKGYAQCEKDKQA